MIDTQATATTQARYQRMAPVYDAMEVLAEQAYRAWRKQLWSLVEGTTLLEVGVGTGKNLPYYPAGRDVTAFDLTPGMLAKAKAQATEQGIDVALLLGDAQAMPFQDGAFDAGVATFVFCSVPDPQLGLRELKRVVKPGGCLYLLEHMRHHNAMVGALMDLANPLAVRATGVNINRRTVANVRASGWELQQVKNMSLDGIFKLMVARNLR